MAGRLSIIHSTLYEVPSLQEEPPEGYSKFCWCRCSECLKTGEGGAWKTWGTYAHGSRSHKTKFGAPVPTRFAFAQTGSGKGIANNGMSLIRRAVVSNRSDVADTDLISTQAELRTRKMKMEEDNLITRQIKILVSTTAAASKCYSLCTISEVWSLTAC